MGYKETILWKKSIDNNVWENDKLRGQLRNAFEKTHENAEYVLNSIRKDFPNLTVHDITHADSLWKVGSTIVGEDYEINPLEGFVLGCAFLMHDAVLSYEAAGGKEQLRNRVEWKDFNVDYKRDTSLTEEQQLYETDFHTIRLLHAKYVEDLYCKVFRKDDNSEFYLIEDNALRTHLGELICKIAASHHWNIEEVERMEIQFPAPAKYPGEWRINPIKLACILRCADAGHIDEGRAPDYMLKLLEKNGVSKDYWIAQNRLSQIDIDKKNQGKIIIKSNIKFKETDFGAWNVAYDAIRVLDHEIRNSNEILRKHGIPEFFAKGVSGAESREALCKYIETDGWMPCDVSIHISNVEKLIENLGGEKLYGTQNKLEIVLRELIQNARDAIIARRKLEEGFEGKITISIDNQEKTWISVRDNGVGMSLLTIKDYFLNFGSSFWASDLAKKEYPGLNSSGFKSIGCFGIGFFSIFMIASEVIVETRRYDKGLDETLQLKFPGGLCLRPLVSRKRGNSTMISTSIKFSVDPQKCQWNKMKKINPGIQGQESFFVPYMAVIANITAGLDVDIFYSEESEKEKKVHTNIDNIELGSPELMSWLKEITYASYRADTVYAQYIENNYMRVRRIECAGQFYGMAALNTLWRQDASYFDVTTVGGLSAFNHANRNPEFLGCLFTSPQTAKRDPATDMVDKRQWAKEQYRILQKEGLTDEDNLMLPYVLGKYEIDMTEDMQICLMNKERMGVRCKLKEILFILKDRHLKMILPLAKYSDYNRITCYTDYYRTSEMLNDDEWIYFTESNSDFLNVKKEDDKYQYNIMYCINLIAKRYSLIVSENIEEDKYFESLSGKGKGLVISIK